MTALGLSGSYVTVGKPPKLTKLLIIPSNFLYCFIFIWLLKVNHDGYDYFDDKILIIYHGCVGNNVCNKDIGNYVLSNLSHQEKIRGIKESIQMKNLCLSSSQKKRFC